MSKRSYISLLAVVIAGIIIALSNVSTNPVGAHTPGAGTPVAVDAISAAEALEQGRALLGRNRSDQSLPLLESALKQFIELNDRSGSAAAHDALGDIYLRHGQHTVALEHFRQAAEAFRAVHETANAALMFAKLGETYYLAGDEAAARAAFARIGEPQSDGAGGDGGNVGAAATGAQTGSGKRDGRRNGDMAGSVAFSSISALLPGLGSCGSSPPNNPPNSSANNSPGNLTSNRPSNNSSNETTDRPRSDAANEPTGETPGKPSGNSSNGGRRSLGHAPKGLDGIGRMDLRVVDQDGNPVKGAKARLSTTRPNGLDCDCWEFTNASGEALLPPIHVGKVLKLEVKAPGYQSYEQIVPPEQLAEPFNVTLQSKNAKGKNAHAAGAQPVSLKAEPPAASNVVAGACFDFNRLFIAYGMSEFGLARADFKRNQLGAAQAHYRNVLAASDRGTQAGDLAAARLFRAVARTSLGDIALRQNNYAEAVKLYTQAAEIARQDARAELTWGAERGLGKTYQAMSAGAPKRPANSQLKIEAVKHYRAALDIIETLFAGSLRADDARTGFLATTKDVIDEAASALAELALKNAPAPVAPDQALAHASHFTTAAVAGVTLEGQSLAYAAEAFRIVEQGKARSLLDMLGDARAEVTEGLPAALLELKRANMARQQEIAGLLNGVAIKRAPPQQAVPELEAELGRLTVEFNSLENQIRSSSPRYSALVRTQPLTLAEVQRQVLDDSTVLLEYNLGAERSYLWTVTRSGLMLYRLPSRADIERQAIELRQQLVPAGARRAIAGIDVENTRGLSDELAKAAAGRGLVLGGPSLASVNVAAYTSAASELYRTIIAPAIANIGDKRLLIVADGSLNYVPFEALVANPNGLDYSALAYLIKTNEIVYAPSASVVAALRQQPRTNAARGGMLIVADPVFDAGDARLKGSTQSAMRARESVQRMALQSALADVTTVQTPGLKLTRLNGTRAEAQQIAQLARASGVNSDTWLDLDANENKVRTSDVSKYRILHVATHGLLNTERPQFTGVVLSLVGNRDADGFLRTDEIFNLKLGSPLVMLSACETGLGKERRGEGVIGLTRAFMYAGAPTVGVSLWSVADRSTAELMPDFYKHLLAERAGAPAAMRAAQLSMIAGKRYSAPFYWAPFVLVGDWR